MIVTSPANSQRIWRQAPQGGVGSSAPVTTATARNLRTPSESAFQIATRSAQTVRPYVEFSMLRPPQILPLSSWIAAPTEKPLLFESALARYRVAASMSSSSPSPGARGRGGVPFAVTSAPSVAAGHAARSERPADRGQGRLSRVLDGRRDPRHGRLQELHESRADPLRGLQHLRVVQGLLQDPRGPVGDRRDAGDAHAG